jgi:membrane-bound inhibitor of C-type lysozyme
MAVFLLAGCAGHHMEEEEHATIPYACANGKQVLVAYEGGGYFPRARASLTYDGRETELRAVPPTYGLRYVSEGSEAGEAHGAGEGHGTGEGHAGSESHAAGEGRESGENAPIMIWSVRGEEAWLTELAPGQTEEREIAHCTRVREEGQVAAEAH